MTQISYDAAKEYVTVYSAAGVAENVIRLNAHDLVRTNGYMWKPVSATPALDPKAPVLENIADLAAIVAASILEEANPKTVFEIEDVPHVLLNQNTAPLAAIALEVAGSTDVAAYLKSFSSDALRTMAEERYGEKIHHRTSFENVIARVIELEDVKSANESDDA